MSSTPFRWGILGAARIARALIPAIRAAGGEVGALGVRDPSSPRAREFAERWQVPLVGPYQDVVDSDVDAVYNPLPNDAHLPWTAAALQAGKHALTEKPLTLNAQEAQHLLSTATQTGRVLLEAFAYRFQPQVLRALEIMHSGQLGEIRALHGSFGFHLQNPSDFRWIPEHGGGSLYDVGTYPVNLVRLLLGQPEKVTAVARFSASGVDVGLDASLVYPNALAGISCGFDWGEASSQGFHVVGTRGDLRMERPFDSHTSRSTTLRWQIEGQNFSQEFPPSNAYARMVMHFQNVARGREQPLFEPDDALGQARVLDALFEAARTGRVVKVIGS
ncbi:gfo/Idh/MocA family oxidoreductase [Deinococcus cavernae]|uniref:Gfo/Idh/MocA family oxidoreductase n=1 Tax=Deinococcus cavernae TaxID=2320857 RepID=A0A418VA23_9DEIO|nr:Gfo/Idh/MocA family oxidoreductase [Deinococcus cavernae]RJF72940.1 gfo/Idh/MocA family oxidoreductase [Deinococcus cavernae]